MDQDRVIRKQELVKDLLHIAAKAFSLASEVKNDPRVKEQTIEEGYIGLKIALQQFAYTKRMTPKKNGNRNPQKRPQKK